MERGEGSHQSRKSFTNRRSNTALTIRETTNVENNVNVNTTNNNDRIPHRLDPDQLLPAANINRIMRRILPRHAKVSEDAKGLIQECVSEYIRFITNEANVRCHREQRMIVNAEDLLYAHARLGFNNYVSPLTTFLNRYRQNEAPQTTVHGGFSRTRTTYFPNVALAPSLPPPSPSRVPVFNAPPTHDYQVQVAQDRLGFLDEAAMNEYYYFQSILASPGTGGNPGGSSGSSSIPAPLEFRSNNDDDDGQFK